MKFLEIGCTRLISQQIAGTNFKTVKEIIGWMGAIQAQDYAMAQWAIGLRLPGSTMQEVEMAFNKGEILRTHLLRPTWHFVSAEDIHWMLELSAPRIKAAMKSRNKQLELTASVFSKSRQIIEKALSTGQSLTREELMTQLANARIKTSDNRLSHLLVQAELDGIICSGITKGKKLTYALLNNRAPKIKTLTREESLARLAQQYFFSRCPATLQDFAWWSGLPVKDARDALEMIRPGFRPEIIDSETYWLHDSFSGFKENKSTVFMLPAFDEFIISYKNRRAALTLENHNKAVSSNGIFRPVIVINGQAAGLWKRTIKNDTLIVEPEFFQPPKKSSKKLIEKAALTYGNFLSKKTEIKFS